MTAPGGRRRPDPLSTSVVAVSRLTPSLVRVVLGGGGLASFRPSPDADSYVKLLFDVPGIEQPRLRTYTVRSFDVASARLTIDVVVHGDAGLAGPWAASAQVGDPVRLLGPGSGYSPDPSADWHLLVGDESALPAIAVALERLPAGAVGRAFVETSGPGHELELTAPAGVEVSWLVRGDSDGPGTLLVPAVTGLDFPAGRVHGFVHGEAGVVRELRRHLVGERGIPLAQLSISGYWRAGEDDEGWRALKRDWNREIEASETAA